MSFAKGVGLWIVKRKTMSKMKCSVGSCPYSCLGNKRNLGLSCQFQNIVSAFLQKTLFLTASFHCNYAYSCTIPIYRKSNRQL